MDATSFIALSGAVYKIVEVLKPNIKRVSDELKWTDDGYSAVVQLVACVLGIIAAFAAGGVNLLPASFSVPQTVGVVVTGIVIGLGSDAVNLVIDLLYALQPSKPAAPPAG